MSIYGGLIPSTTSQMTMTYRLLEYKYGNSYAQRAPDGINFQIEKWQLNFDQRTAAAGALLETWLASVPPYTPFNGDGTFLSASKLYWMTTDGWQKTWDAGNVVSYVLNVEQTF